MFQSSESLLQGAGASGEEALPAGSGGQGLGMSSFCVWRATSQGDAPSPVQWLWHAAGIGPTGSVPSLGLLCSQSATEHRTAVTVRG